MAKPICIHSPSKSTERWLPSPACRPDHADQGIVPADGCYPKAPRVRLASPIAPQRPRSCVRFETSTDWRGRCRPRKSGRARFSTCKTPPRICPNLTAPKGNFTFTAFATMRGSCKTCSRALPQCGPEDEDPRSNRTACVDAVALVTLHSQGLQQRDHAVVFLENPGHFNQFELIRKRRRVQAIDQAITQRGA